MRFFIAVFAVGGMLACGPGEVAESTTSGEKASPGAPGPTDGQVTAMLNPQTPPPGNGQIWQRYYYFSDATFSEQVGFYREECGELGWTMRGSTSYYWKSVVGSCEWGNVYTECQAYGVTVPCP